MTVLPYIKMPPKEEAFRKASRNNLLKTNHVLLTKRWEAKKKIQLVEEELDIEEEKRQNISQAL